MNTKRLASSGPLKQQ